MFDKVRAVVEPPIPALPPTPLIERASRLPWLGLCLLVLLTWWCCGGSSSPWMRFTLPGGAQSANTVAGQSVLYNGDFYQSDGLVPLEQLDLLKGNRETFERSAADNAFPIGYAVLGNLFTAGLSSCYALWVFNLVLYGLCTVLVARLTEILFNDRTKTLLAAALFVPSIAATTHVGDLSPHLLTMAFCYALTLVLARLDSSDRPITGRAVFGLSALLGGWSLVSTSSMFGLAIVSIFFIKKQKTAALALPALAWYTVPQLQHALFAHFGLNLPLGSVGELAWQGFHQHWVNFSADPARYGLFLAVQLGNMLANDNPFDVLIGVFGLVILRHRAKWLLAVCLFVPLAVNLVLLPTSPLRGCAVAGNTIVLFAVISHFAVEGSRWLGSKIGAQPAAIPLVMLLVLQVGWGYSTHFGWLYPSAAYATGAVENVGLLRSAAILPMTGPVDERPTVAGGRVPASISYGVADGFGRQSFVPVKRVAPYANRWSALPTLLKTLALQAPLLGCLLFAGIALMRWRWSFSSALLLAAGLASSQLCGAATGLDRHVLRPFDERLSVKEDEKLRASVHLSEEFRSMLEEAAQTNRQVEFAVRVKGINASMSKPAEMHVDEWSSDDSRFSVPAAQFLEALQTHGGRVEFALSPKAGSRGLLVHSWQSQGNRDALVVLGGSAGSREATIVRADGSIEPLEWFPSFEIRVLRGDNAAPLQRVIGRFESARPASYALIGF